MSYLTTPWQDATSAKPIRGKILICAEYRTGPYTAAAFDGARYKDSRGRTVKPNIWAYAVPHTDGEKAVTVHSESYYALGEPMSDEIVAGHILLNLKRVEWCSAAQKWVEA